MTTLLQLNSLQHVTRNCTDFHTCNLLLYGTIFTFVQIGQCITGVSNMSCELSCYNICNKKSQGTFYVNQVILIIVLYSIRHKHTLLWQLQLLTGKIFIEIFIRSNDVEPQNYFDNINSYFMKTGCVIACSFTNFLKLCYCSSLPVMFIGQWL